MKIELPGLEKLDFDGKRVLLRVDFNVPIDKVNCTVTDNSRIVKTLPTIEYILKQGGAIVLISHLGRPKNSSDTSCSMGPVADALKELLSDVKIEYIPFTPVEGLMEKCKSLKSGEILVLENIRYFEHETSEKKEERTSFARKLARLGDCFVNDAFGACHREHATVFELAKELPSVAGFLLKKEISILSGILTSPARPFTAIIGGSKVSSKIKVLSHLINKVDNILIGGGMAYTFLKGKGLHVGNSLIENELLSHSFQIIDKANFNETGFFIPEDHIGSTEFSENGKIKSFGLEIAEGWMGMDIGPKTIKKYEKIIQDSKTILWNGPMGVFEMDKFAEGTMAIARAISKNKGVTVIGGGDSLFAIKKAGVEEKITHVSTGGGATLEFLEGKKLPGVIALTETH